MRRARFVAIVTAAILLLSLPLRADEPSNSTPQPPDPAAGQPDDAAGAVAATQPASRPWFLTLPASTELFRHIESGDLKALDNLSGRRQASMVMWERDEWGLLLALRDLKAGKIAAAKGQFAALARAVSPKVALSARRYERVLTSYPDGKTEGVSLADYPTFQAVCRKLASDEAANGDELLAEVEVAKLLTAEDWEDAWAKLAEARKPFDAAGVLDESFPANRAERLKSAETMLAGTGARMLRAKAEQQRSDLLAYLRNLEQGGTGRWGPPLLVKKVNDQIDELIAAKRQFVELVDILGKSVEPPVAGSAKPAKPADTKQPSTGKRPVAGKLAAKQLDIAELRQQAEEMDCLRFLKTTDGERQFKTFSQFFKEVKVVPPTKGKEPTYRLLRVEKILR